MIFITAKFRVLPEDADSWPEIGRASCRERVYACV